MEPYRYRYRSYSVKIESGSDGYSATIWIYGSLETKEIVVKNAYSLGLAQRGAEIKIDKILSIGGILA